MNGIRASQRFEIMSKRLGNRLHEHAQETFPPDAQKGLRRFAMREAAELLRINQNTFRHHVANLEGFPEGILEGGNRRSFSAEEMVEAQRVLLETGRMSGFNDLQPEGRLCQDIVCCTHWTTIGTTRVPSFVDRP
jgi:chromosome partitioning protein